MLKESNQGYDIELFTREARLDLESEKAEIAGANYRVIEDYWANYDAMAQAIRKGQWFQTVITLFDGSPRPGVTHFDKSAVVVEALRTVREMYSESEEEAINHLREELQKVITFSK